MFTVRRCVSGDGTAVDVGLCTLAAIADIVVRVKGDTAEVFTVAFNTLQRNTMMSTQHVPVTTEPLNSPLKDMKFAYGNLQFDSSSTKDRI